MLFVYEGMNIGGKITVSKTYRIPHTGFPQYSEGRSGRGDTLIAFAFLPNFCYFDAVF